MKTIFFLFLISFAVLTANAQTVGKLQPVLDNYLQLSDALIKSDGKKAVEQADNLQSAIQSVQEDELETTLQQQFSSAKTGLLAAVQKITRKADLDKQRPAFAELSELLWPIFKATESSDQTIYYDYCPMKKAYWISMEAKIKNPYYGAAMLSCGHISEQKN